MSLFVVDLANVLISDQGKVHDLPGLPERKLLDKNFSLRKAREMSSSSSVCYLVIIRCC